MALDKKIEKFLLERLNGKTVNMWPHMFYEGKKLYKIKYEGKSNTIIIYLVKDGNRVKIHEIFEMVARMPRLIKHSNLYKVQFMCEPIYHVHNMKSDENQLVGKLVLVEEEAR